MLTVANSFTDQWQEKSCFELFTKNIPEPYRNRLSEVYSNYMKGI